MDQDATSKACSLALSHARAAVVAMYSVGAIEHRQSGFFVSESMMVACHPRVIKRRSPFSRLALPSISSTLIKQFFMGSPLLKDRRTSLSVRLKDHPSGPADPRVK